MQDLDENTVTDAVLAQMEGTPDARLREIMEAAVRHLHAFAREVRLTPAEWLTGIAFLTEVGKTCTPSRQETILLSDVIGLSALVNAMHDRTAGEAGTHSSLLGPFYREGAPELQSGDCLAQEAKGQIVFCGRVVGPDGAGVPHARVQVWQTDADGYYDMQLHGQEKMDTRGNFTCDADGYFHFRTVRPLGYYIPMDGPVGRLVTAQHRHGCRPAHIHFLIGAEGYRELVTSLYLADDQYIDTDTVFGVSSSLIVSPGPDVDTPFPALPAIRYAFELVGADGAGASRVGADPSKLVGASG